MTAAIAEPPILRFGERLVQLGKIKPSDLERALRAQAEINQPIGSVLVRLGVLTEQEVAVVLSRHIRVPLAMTRDYPETAVEDLGISINYMRSSEILPLRIE
ncbi:MAG: General secretion pathway protein E, partial [uncultured Thiotrichaceae bacterium]